MIRFQSDVLLPEVPMEKSPCHRETLTATAEVPQEMLLATENPPTEILPALPSMVPSAEAGKDPCRVELLPCPEKLGTCPSKVPPIMVPVLPTTPQMPAEQPRRLVSRGSCLIHNWQEEVSLHYHHRGHKGKCPSRPAPLCPTHGSHEVPLLLGSPLFK